MSEQEKMAGAAPAENKMGVMPVKRLLISMALPMMVSMLVQALYNVVDSIFVSQISEDALSAVSMAFPMQNLLIGVSSGIGVGTNALLSKALGEKKQETANKMALHGLMLSAIAYLIFLCLGLTIVRFFFKAQGASDVIADYGTDYLSIVMIFSFGMFAQMIFERLLQATGRTLFTMFTQGTGAIINIILDPIMIFGYFGCPAFGIKGAAIATVIGQIIAGIMAIIFNLKKNNDISFSFKGFKPELRAIGRILYIGVPSMIMVAIGSVMTFCVNKILVVFSSTAVAVFGAYYKLQSFAFMPVFGLNNGMIPILAYNYGARKPKRVMDTLKFSLIIAACIMIAAFILVQCIPGKLLLLFSASEEMLGIGIPALRTISISFLIAWACVILGSFFQAMGNGISSMLVSFTRQLIFLVPLVFIFSKIGTIDLVWWAWPIAEVASLILSVFFSVRLYNQKIKPMYDDKK